MVSGIVMGLHAFCETLESGVVVYDLEGVMRYANGFACRLLGKPCNELIGKSLVDLSPGEPWDEDTLTDAQGSGGKFSYDICYARPDGEKRWLSIAGQPLQSEQGEPIGSLLSVSDITEAKARQIELETMQETLEQRVRDRTRALSMANRKLALQIEERVAAEDAARWANSKKTAFLSSVSHELRTPLNAVIGYTELVLDQPQITVKEASDDLGLIHYSATHLLGLIDDILDLAKLDIVAGQDRADDPLHDLIHEVADIMRHRVEAEGASLELEVATHFVCRTGARKLKHILFALLGVAAQFSAGGVVSLKASDVGRDARIAVSISGPGPAPSDLRELFEPFVHLDGPHRAGVGLALALEYTRALGGNLIVDNRPDGCCFLLTIPAA